MLRSFGHVGKIYSTTDSAAVLGMTVGVDSNEGISIEVSASFVVCAFVFDGKEEYSLSYREKFGYKDDNHILHYRCFGRAV